MIPLKLLTSFAILYLASVTGQTQQASFNQDLVTYIDYEKYLANEGQRLRRQTENAVNAIIRPVTPTNGYVPFYNFYYPRYNFPSNGFAPEPSTRHEFQNYGYNQQRYQEPFSICADPVNEVYQECGNKCVLGCRYANTRDARDTASASDCDKYVCVAGCFCKAGLVRHQSRCIPATECPIPKCQPNEVYQCSPAVPITCQNVFRIEEIIEETKNLDCDWGCSCAEGYVRKSENGQCVPDSDCRGSQTNENIDDSSRVLDSNSERLLSRPGNSNPHCFGPGCKQLYQVKPSFGKPSKPKPGKPIVTINNHSKPGPHNKPSHHTHHAGGSGNIAINNYNNFLNDPSNKANGTGSGSGNNGWNFVPVIPVYPYYPGNASSNNNGPITITNTNDNTNYVMGEGSAGNSSAPNTINNNTINVTIPNNNTNTNNNNFTSSPVTNVTQQNGSSSSSATPSNIVNNNTNTLTNGNTIPIMNTNGTTNATISGITLPGTGALLNIPGVGVIIGTIIPGVQIPGLPGINLPNTTQSNTPGTNRPNSTFPSGNIGLNIPGLGNLSIGTDGISANIGIPGLVNVGAGISSSGAGISASTPLASANVGTSGAGLNVGIPGLANAEVNLGQRDEDDTNTSQESPSAPPMDIEFDSSNYYLKQPNREQNSKEKPDIKTQTSTNRPNSMKNGKPTLTQYIPQPNAYANTAPPNLFAQPTYFGANPFGQYQFSAPPNGYFDYPQIFQPNNQGYPQFRFQKRK